jgi:hypothetical protein
VHSHVRRLDLRAGTLTREVEWSAPAGDRGADHLGAAGLAEPARGRRHPLHG